MKRTLLSVKELAQELGISTDSVCRAYRTGEIPGVQIARIIRFDLGQVLRVMEERAKAMPNSQCAQRRATAGASRRRAAIKRPRSVIRGLVSQSSK
jgi:DNA-binding transcriptional regulator YhcF (GntR family)